MNNSHPSLSQYLWNSMSLLDKFFILVKLIHFLLFFLLLVLLVFIKFFFCFTHILFFLKVLLLLFYSFLEILKFFRLDFLILFSFFAYGYHISSLFVHEIKFLCISTVFQFLLPIRGHNKVRLYEVNKVLLLFVISISLMHFFWIHLGQEMIVTEICCFC